MTKTEKIIQEMIYIIGNDGLAISFQSLSQYREMLISELSALKSELKEEWSGLKKFNDTEWAEPLWRRDQDVKEVVKEEQSLNDEEVDRFINRNRKICWESEFENDEYCIGENKVKEFLRSFRDQGRDWENIEKEFTEWFTDIHYTFRNFSHEIFNWFKNNL